MKIEIVIVYFLGIVIIILGMLLSYKEARKDRFSYHKKNLLIPIVISIVQSFAFCATGLIPLLLSFSHRDKMWYVYPLLVCPFILDLICTKAGYRKIKKYRVIGFGLFI